MTRISPRLHLLSPKGFRAASVAAGIKSRGKPDVALLICDTLATAAAVFTTNKVFAAPVKIGHEHLRASDGQLRGVVVNAGNANACTGRQGERDARSMCAIAARAIGCDSGQLLPSSTGIIGHVLPMRKLERGIVAASSNLGSTARHATQFADAILTTDTKRKTAAAQFKVGRKLVTVAGVCKGSGMIGPRMAARHATMLAYLTTDARVAPRRLQELFQHSAAGSFNAITVDDHTSTNDTAVLLASGASGASIESPRDAGKFARALDEVCQSLAYQIVADGEGATKVVRVEVIGAANGSDANRIARAIASSPLVKCAMHGNDPNWGRIVSAAGMCGAAFDPNLATLELQRTRVFHRGKPLSFDAKRVSRSLRAKDVLIRLRCNLGPIDAIVWTCDLSKDYVSINADYHT